MPDDGNTTYVTGQDASKAPHLVPDTGYYKGINVTTQNGVLGPRPGMRELPFKFPNKYITTYNTHKVSYEEYFRSGVKQAAIPHIVGSDRFILCVVSGIVFTVNQRTYDVNTLHLPFNDHINDRKKRVNWALGNRYLFLLDYPNFPVVIEGVNIRRSDPTKYEIPISRLAGLNQNRSVVVNGGNQWTAGDPTGSTATPNAPLTFIEAEAPGQDYVDQIFDLPTNAGNSNIVAVAFLPQVDASTSIGPLLLATNKNISAFHTELPRAQWQAGNFGSIFVSGSGFAGARTWNVNGQDVFYQDVKGKVRSISMSRSEQSKWSKSPLSNEVKNWLAAADPTLLKYGAIGHTDTRMFVTANPYRAVSKDFVGNPVYDVIHGGMVVLETDNVSTLSTDSQPAWAGLWTGIYPTDFIESDDGRFFVFGAKEGNVNTIVEISDDFNYDYISNQKRQIRSVIYTRAYQFQAPFDNKLTKTCDFNLAEVEGDFRFDVSMKSDGNPNFNHVRTFTDVAPTYYCKVPDVFNELEAHSYRDMLMGMSQPGVCNPASRSFADVFRQIQLRLEITADNWELRGNIVRCDLRQNDQTQDIKKDAQVPHDGVELIKQCTVSDWAIPEVSECPMSLIP